MNVSEIDCELTQWRDRQRLIDENLNSFIELPLFQRLTTVAADNPPQFTGKTRDRLAAALDVFHKLHAQRATLVAALDRANVLRAQLSRLIPDRQTLDEIEQILIGPSIQLECSPTPPEHRELLRDVEQSVRVSPSQCLEGMLESFRLVRDTLVCLESAERQNAEQLNQQRAELDRLASTAASLNFSAPLDDARKLLAQLDQQATSDPLGTADQIATLAAMLHAAAAAINVADAHRRDALNLLRDAKQLNDQLRSAHDRAKAASAERLLKVASTSNGHDPLPASDADVAALAHWLAKLETTIQKQQFGPAAIGLKKWTEAASALLAHERRATESADAALSARRALRGLFDALQAKAAGMGRNHPHLTQMSGEIAQLLAHRPTPMAQVQQLIAKYQEQLA
jgi:hypothetical protein